MDLFQHIFHQLTPSWWGREQRGLMKVPRELHHQLGKYWGAGEGSKRQRCDGVYPYIRSAVLRLSGRKNDDKIYQACMLHLIVLNYCRWMSVCVRVCLLALQNPINPTTPAPISTNRAATDAPNHDIHPPLTTSKTLRTSVYNGHKVSSEQCQKAPHATAATTTLFLGRSGEKGNRVKNECQQEHGCAKERAGWLKAMRKWARANERAEFPKTMNGGSTHKKSCAAVTLAPSSSSYNMEQSTTREGNALVRRRNNNSNIKGFTAYEKGRWYQQVLRTM